MEPFEATEGVEGVERDMGGATIISFFRLWTDVADSALCNATPNGACMYILQTGRYRSMRQLVPLRSPRLPRIADTF